MVLMGYLNPIEALGYEQFAKLAGEAGVDGVITVISRRKRRMSIWLRCRRMG